jgi:hypothetical protein
VDYKTLLPYKYYIVAGTIWEPQYPQVSLWFEVLTAVLMKSSVLWGITPCSPLKVNRRFGGTCRLHLQGRRTSKQETNVKQVASRVILCNPKFRQVDCSAWYLTCFTLVSWLACYLTLKMEATCSSESSVDFQRTTRRYIPEDKTLHKWV